jgi:hypothetical protein
MNGLTKLLEMFDIIDETVAISPPMLNVPEFKALWRRDKNRNKKEAYSELCYIYYITDFKSPYRTYPKKEREQRVLTEFCYNVLGEDWKPDEKVIAAKKKYEELQVTPSLRYLESVEGVIAKITQFLDKTNIDEDTLKTIVDSIEKANKITLGLPKLKEAIEKEISENTKIRGGGDTGLFEE